MSEKNGMHDSSEVLVAVGLFSSPSSLKVVVAGG
jgi:hypothetical protein